jgi:hypothetical protein
MKTFLICLLMLVAPLSNAETIAKRVSVKQLFVDLHERCPAYINRSRSASETCLVDQRFKRVYEVTFVYHENRINTAILSYVPQAKFMVTDRGDVIEPNSDYRTEDGAMHAGGTTSPNPSDRYTRDPIEVKETQYQNSNRYPNPVQYRNVDPQPVQQQRYQQPPQQYSDPYQQVQPQSYQQPQQQTYQQPQQYSQPTQTQTAQQRHHHRQQ